MTDASASSFAKRSKETQEQKEYNERYDALVSCYEETEQKRDAVMERIDLIMIQRRKIERFIERRSVGVSELSRLRGSETIRNT